VFPDEEEELLPVFFEGTEAVEEDALLEGVQDLPVRRLMISFRQSLAEFPQSAFDVQRN
jgi:hypothetical protein